MANEAIVTIIARMHDEASPKMQTLGKTTHATATNMREFKMSLIAVGVALTSVGALIGKIDSPMAKMTSNFLLTAGAIISTASAIMWAIPQIKALITTLRGLAIAQAIVKALSGPVGWAQIGIGLGIAAVAGATIAAMTGAFEGGSRAMQSERTINIAGGPLILTNDADMRKFARTVSDYQRDDAKRTTGRLP